ncbi:MULTISPECIES: hypothetical protein [Streptomyces]|uniref:Uncharacterized protein n=2 Tax=Streptomyces TaxID=1883 RepID=A0ABW7T5W9_9ACTN
MALRSHALLPRRYDDRKVLATTVDAWGRALWLLCPDAELVPNPYGRPSPVPRRRPYDALLVISDAGAVQERVLRNVTLHVYDLDALPNGRIILDGYGGTDEPNTQIYGRDGRPRRRLSMGRAMGFLMADRLNHLWSAYGDEGVFADPISSAGLVRWDSGGNRRWGYTPPEGGRHIVDVYALNVGDGVAHAAYYPTFPLLQAHADGRIHVRKSRVTGPSGIAVHGDDVVMLGGDGQHDRLHRCRMTDQDVLVVDEAVLTMPNGAPLKRYARPVGRGRRLYLHGASSKQWYVLEV